MQAARHTELERHTNEMGEAAGICENILSLLSDLAYLTPMADNARACIDNILSALEQDVSASAEQLQEWVDQLQNFLDEIAQVPTPAFTNKLSQLDQAIFQLRLILRTEWQQLTGNDPRPFRLGVIQQDGQGQMDPTIPYRSYLKHVGLFQDFRRNTLVSPENILNLIRRTLAGRAEDEQGNRLTLLFRQYAYAEGMSPTQRFLASTGFIAWRLEMLSSAIKRYDGDKDLLKKVKEKLDYSGRSEDVALAALADEIVDTQLLHDIGFFELLISDERFQEACLFHPSEVLREVILREMSEMPRCFLCPVSGDVMQQPVKTEDGRRYDKPSLDQWMDQRASQGRASLTDPITNLETSRIVEVDTLAAEVIQRHQQYHPALYEVSPPEDLSPFSVS